jgi:UDP-N-acetylglucosamine 1-carboxyvinyltransferase
MSKFIIEGGVKLKGEISVKGAKNAALKIIPAAILSRETIKITNLPDIEDIDKSINLITDLGGTVKRNGKNELSINTGAISKIELNPVFANKFRASIMFVGPLLARFGEVNFPHPGGCVIGAGERPIDIFIEGFKSFGAELRTNESFYTLKTKKLKGCEYFFPTVSVTGTESLMMTAVLADGTTKLKNCAMEPEIGALAEYLNKHGARISGAGTPMITIEGVKSIGAGTFNIIPDRIETGSFAIMAAATESEIIIKDCYPEHIEILLNILNRIGADLKIGKNEITVKGNGLIAARSIKTHEYPGFPTDLQSPYTVLMTQAKGTSLIHETIYDRRLLFVDLLAQMGADITMCDPHRVVVNGPTPLQGRKLTSPDLRAGIAMIIAALAAKGTTEIDNIYQIDRGYENIDGRLQRLGAKIERISA